MPKHPIAFFVVALVALLFVAPAAPSIAAEVDTAAVSGTMPTPAGAGEVVCRSAEFTTDGTTTVATPATINMLPVPKGAMIVDIQFYTTDTGTATVADIGDSVDPDRFWVDLDTASAAVLTSLWQDGAATGVGHVYAADDVISVVLDTSLPVSSTVYMNACYKMMGAIGDEQSTFTD